MATASDALEREFEGCILYAYDDANDKRIMPGDTIEGTLTIGFGHTGPDVHPGMTITQSQADALLDSDMRQFAIAVQNMVTHDCTPNQFSALVDFAFNEGAGALYSSTLLRLFNAGDIQGAADQFLVWDVANEGLQRRRHAERTLFLAP